MSKYCPHCECELDTLDYNANYSETVYGSSNGTYDIENGSHENQNYESNDSDGFEEDEFEYICPECREEVDLDELLDEIDDEDDDEVDRPTKDAVKMVEFFKRAK